MVKRKVFGWDAGMGRWGRKEFISLDFFKNNAIISLDFFDFCQIICLDYFFFVSLRRENSYRRCITNES